MIFALLKVEILRNVYWQNGISVKKWTNFLLFSATIFLNKTNGKVALPLFWDFLSKWPNPKAVGDAQEGDISTFLQPIGLYNRWSQLLFRPQCLLKFLKNSILCSLHNSDWKGWKILNGEKWWYSWLPNKQLCTLIRFWTFFHLCEMLFVRTTSTYY